MSGVGLVGVEADVMLADFRLSFAALTEAVMDPVMADLYARGLRVMAAAKDFARGAGEGPHVVTGRLWNSIGIRLGRDTLSPYVDVGTAVHYCVFGGHTCVVTDRGQRAICQLQPGDRVLTQAGDYQRVLVKTAFPAVERPDLVDIVVPWRKDRPHRLTLTVDHKVLCFREGRNQWVMAGDLRGTDLLYDRVGRGHDEDSGAAKLCEWCEEGYRGQGRRYCSTYCRDAAWAAGANPHLGAIRSEAARARMSAAATATGCGLRLNRQLAEMGYQTKPELEVAEWLEERGVVYERQVAFGGYVVDFFLPERREIIEADGGYWHQDQARDVERDRELLRACPGVEITHLHFFDKNRSPELIDPEPLPGVRYVVCNPGTDSFTDPTAFRRRPVTVERHWRYGDSLKPKGSPQALLYDVEVENVHSFLAGGVIVSNSPFVEFGHNNTAHVYPIMTPGGTFTGTFGFVSNKPTRAFPFLRPAIAAAYTT